MSLINIAVRNENTLKILIFQFKATIIMVAYFYDDAIKETSKAHSLFSFIMTLPLLS